MGETGALILQVVVISLTVLFFLFLIGNHYYRKSKGLPTGDCACCHKGTKKMLKEYRKLYSKNN
ncbi:MAG: hypothetical protein K6C32_01880 [Bacilli bacterium]|nr:hypothetical protein [Bacilli bacterium]